MKAGGRAGSGTGLAYAFDATIVARRVVISARAVSSVAIDYWNPDERSTDYSILAGVGVADAYEHASIEVEIGLVHITYRNTYMGLGRDVARYEYITQSTAGVSWQLQMYHRRIGLMVYGNINKTQSYARGLYCVRFGKLE